MFPRTRFYRNKWIYWVSLVSHRKYFASFYVFQLTMFITINFIHEIAENTLWIVIFVNLELVKFMEQTILLYEETNEYRTISQTKIKLLIEFLSLLNYICGFIGYLFPETFTCKSL